MNQQRSSLSVQWGTMLSLNHCFSLLAISEEVIKCRKEPGSLVCGFCDGVGERGDGGMGGGVWGVGGWRTGGAWVVFCSRSARGDCAPFWAWCKRQLTISQLSQMCSKTTQRNKQIAMGRKKFNMDPKKVSRHSSFLACRRLSDSSVLMAVSFWIKVVIPIKILRVDVQFLS